MKSRQIPVNYPNRSTAPGSTVGARRRWRARMARAAKAAARETYKPITDWEHLNEAGRQARLARHG